MGTFYFQIKYHRSPKKVNFTNICSQFLWLENFRQRWFSEKKCCKEKLIREVLWSILYLNLSQFITKGLFIWACLLDPTPTWVWCDPFFCQVVKLRFGKIGGREGQAWKSKWLNLSTSPETSMSHTPSEPWHSQPWLLIAFHVCKFQSVNSDSPGTDGCNILAFPRQLSLPAACGNTVGSLLCHLSADFEENSDPRRPHGRVHAWLVRFCNRSWNPCCGKSSLCTSLLA